MVEKNRLIAEFMGISVMNISEYTEHLREMQRNGLYYQTSYVLDSSLTYESDWNMLMLVIERILDVFSNPFKNIKDCIPNIEQTYIEVVKFIKWYNKNNIENEKENSI